MRIRWAVTAAVLAAGVTACAAPTISSAPPEPVAAANLTVEASAWDPPLHGPQQATEWLPDHPGYFVCYDEFGFGFPQAETMCPAGWGGRPPENPKPLGGPVGIGAPVP